MMFRASKLAIAMLLTLMTPLGAQAAEEQDFIEFAGSHCRAFLSEGRADMAFAMGKASAKFSQAEMLQFNRQFANKMITEYNIDPAKGCTLDVLSMKPVIDESHKPAEKGRYAQPKAKREIAVVAGVMGSKNNEAPVSVAYRLERVGVSPWIITNITLNGQPMVDRYRVEYEALAAKGGSDALLENM